MSATAPISAALVDFDAYAEAIRAEQTKVIYRYLLPLLAINALVAGGMVFGLWNIVQSSWLVAWMAAMLAVIAARAGLYAIYRRKAGERPDGRWRIWFTIGSGAAGLLWGAAGVVLFPPDSSEYQLFILFVLVGMGAGAVSSLTAYMPAFYAYFPISMLPISALLFRLNDPIHIGLGLMTVVYVAALVFFGNTINKALVESLSLRFANVDLVKQLSQQRDEAERANIAKSKFLAAASHDLRQPLHALTLFTTALDERIKYPEARRIVDNINASVRALEKLFNALLDISRLDAGVLQPEIRHFALHPLLSRLVVEYTPEAETKGLEVICAPSTTVVHSDPALLERILRNYLSNAIRYTDNGEVRLDETKTTEGLRIDVVDTGIGVPESQHRAIFNEFHQLGNPERDRAKGLGLGLAIVERVARLLDSPIAVESEPGRGARFSVTVPLGEPGQVTAEPPMGLSDPRHDVEGLHVVIVDDEVNVREGMTTLLAQWGCNVTAVGSEEEGVAALHATSRPPDVIIVDYRLREERTGVQAIARLRQTFGAEIPALIVTGDTAPERLREARQSGHPLVHKPVQPAALRAFLRKARLRTAPAG